MYVSIFIVLRCSYSLLGNVLEGELLFREYQNYPGQLPQFSERISLAIAKVMDRCYMQACNTSRLAILSAFSSCQSGDGCNHRCVGRRAAVRSLVPGTHCHPLPYMLINAYQRDLLLVVRVICAGVAAAYQRKPSQETR